MARRPPSEGLQEKTIADLRWSLVISPAPLLRAVPFARDHRPGGRRLQGREVQERNAIEAARPDREAAIAQLEAERTNARNRGDRGRAAALTEQLAPAP